MTDSTGIEVVRKYLELGRSGLWAWESLVEDIAAIRQLDANGREPEAIMMAADALCKRLPNENVNAWRGLLGNETVMAEIIEIVCQQFEIVSNLEPARRCIDASELETRAACADERLLECFRLLRDGPRMTYPGHVFPRSASAVYGLWRHPEVEKPSYVGESTHLARSLGDRHKRWWGTDKPMYVSYIEDGMVDFRYRRAVERFLILVFQPVNNTD
jgi:hypothetical protein